MVDTSSTELVVLSNRCKYWCGQPKDFYESEASRYYQDGHLGVVLSFTGGTLRGNEAYDRFSVGQFLAQWQPFWEITDADMSMLFYTNFSGILGLGPMSDHMRTMIPGNDQNHLRYALTLSKLLVWEYSLCLDWEPGSAGYLTWNDDILDTKKRSRFTNLGLVDDSKFWMVVLGNVTLGGHPIGCQDGCGAVLDVTTPMLALPESAYENLGNAIAKLEPNCRSLSNMPHLRFTLDGHNYSLPPDAYFSRVFGNAPVDLLDHFKIDHFPNPKNSSCQAAIMKLTWNTSVGEMWVLGAPFFRSYYTLFVQDTLNMVYTAPAGDNCDLLNESDEPKVSVSEDSHTLHGASDDDYYDYKRLQTDARNVDAADLAVPWWWKTISSVGHAPKGRRRAKAKDPARVVLPKRKLKKYKQSIA